MKLYYVTTNKFKIDEAMDYFRNNEVASRFGIEICIIEHNVQEILDADIHKIVERKVIDASAHVGRPCVVEHGGLFFDALPKLPGALGKIIWDAVGERMCQFLAQGDSRQATARSCIGYCDGKTVKTYHGETRGRIAERARGDYVFHWDTIFIPEGSDQTYGEIGREGKRASSQVVKAWEAFLGGTFAAAHPPRFSPRPPGNL